MTDKTYFINLASQRDCNEFIRHELETAGIKIIEGVDGQRNEVPYNVVGVLGGRGLSDSEVEAFQNSKILKLNKKILIDGYPYVFIRNWNYYVVIGLISLSAAKEIYRQTSGTVRVAGHCANPDPSAWINRSTVLGQQVVSGYHIDDQDGLNLFVQILRENNLF